MDTIVVIAGPTAVGKTAYAIALAQRFHGEIVSCDSMQLYKYLDIGSAKPTAEEQAQVPHHVVDIIDPKEPFTVAKYEVMAEAAIRDVRERGYLPFIAGGTGLYLDSLLYDMDFGTSGRDDAYRESLFSYAEREGAEALHDRLKAVDPKGAERIHPNNIKRVVRALEAAERFGEPLSDYGEDLKEKPGRKAVLMGLTRDREALYERINLRVDLLMEQGLLEEVKGLSAMGFTQDDIAMKGIGYKELLAYLDGEYDLEEAIRLIKRNTRRYAKRQITWFRKYKDMRWFDVGEEASFDEHVEEMAAWLSKKL